MAEGRELILKLGQKITDRIGVKVTTSDPEYWGLACVITDEMAEVALAMKVRVPATAQWIAKRCKKSVERTEELLQEMSVIGLIEYNWENEDRHKQYVLPMFVPGCAEFMMMNAKQVEEHPELEEVFEKVTGIISDSDMAQMNYQVETEGREPRDVAEDFLDARGLLK